MKSLYPGICLNCGSAFRKGDEINYRDKKVIGCPKCAQRELIDTKETPEEMAARMKFRRYEWSELLREETEDAERKKGAVAGCDGTSHG